MKFKKNKVKGAFGWFSSLNPDAGDVEYNNKVFNNSTDTSNVANSSSSDTAMSSGSGMGEELDSNVDSNLIQEDSLSEAISSKDIADWCDTSAQEETLKLISRIAKRECVGLHFGTKVGKYPQSLIIDHGYQDDAIRICANGSCTIKNKKFGDYKDENFDINDFKKDITTAIKDMSSKKEESVDLKEELSLSELVKDSISHLVNDLGKDSDAEDFADDVINDIENNYDVDVDFSDPLKYKNWASEVACEVSRQLNNTINEATNQQTVYKVEYYDPKLYKWIKFYETRDIEDAKNQLQTPIFGDPEKRIAQYTKSGVRKIKYDFVKRIDENMSSEKEIYYTLHQTNENGDSYTKENYITKDDVRKALNELIDTYTNYGSENVRGLLVTEGDDDKQIALYWSADGMDWVKDFDLLDNNSDSNLSESANHLDTDYQKKNIIDYYEMVIDPYGDLQSSFESEDEYRQSLMDQLSNIDYIDEWINQYSDESGFVEMLKELKATMTDNSSTIEESKEDTQYGVHSFSQQSIIFRGTEEQCAKFIEDNELWDDAEIYTMTPDDPHYLKEAEEKLTTYYQVYSRYESDNKFVFIDEFDTVKKAIDEALYHMDNGSQVKVFAVEEDTDGNIVGKRQELLIYSDNAIQNWSDSEFDVADPQEVANMFGKPTYSNKNGKVYFPKATEALKEYVESDEFIALENKLRTTLKEKGIKLNTAECTPEDATEYILMTRENTGDYYYSVEDWIKDTLNNYPEMLITNESIELAYTDDVDDEYEENLDEQMIKEDTIPVADTTSYTLEYGINGKTSDVHYLDNLDRYEVKNLVEDLLMTDEYDYIYVTKRYTIERDGHFNTVFEDVLDAYLDKDCWIANVDLMNFIK